MKEDHDTVIDTTIEGSSVRWVGNFSSYRQGIGGPKNERK